MAANQSIGGIYFQKVFAPGIKVRDEIERAVNLNLRDHWLPPKKKGMQDWRPVDGHLEWFSAASGRLSLV